MSTTRPKAVLRQPDPQVPPRPTLPLPVSELAIYGLHLRPAAGGRAAESLPRPGIPRSIGLSSIPLARLPALPNTIPSQNWQRAADVAGGWQIDMLDGPPGGEFRVWSVLADRSGCRLQLSEAEAPRAALAWDFFTRVTIRYLLARLGTSILHGNLSRTPAGAVALLGDSGAGKSSLAIALMRAGAPPLADDVVCPVRLDAGWHAWPGHHEILAEPQTLARLGIDPHAHPLIWDARTPGMEDKHVLAAALPHDPDPVPVAGIVTLDPRRSDAAAPALHRLPPAAAVAAVLPHGHWQPAGPDRRTRLADIVALASAVPVWRLSRPDRIADLPAAADLVLAAAAAPI